ncbi:Alpha/Beta hydrolase protein [Lentinula edodes]|uniref:Alpha/Beta hydrolase protein n=1 Tax=Lentinula edodes TaxID=5353 RepID=UPI001E8DB7E4|nr:Alpha/Beta hydrolase protein [Lentinula edodes]KAH7875002.1 Alpha/Beta hydrolase protein [Lentinula edodes]
MSSSAPSHHTLTLPKIDETQYALLTRSQYLWMKLKFLFLPFIITTELLISPFVARSKNKALKRVIGDAPFRFLIQNFAQAELQHLFGTDVGVYSTWARKANLPVVIDELDDGAKLMWIGPKRNEKVILYCHGGGYHLPVQAYAISFWRYIQVQLEKRGVEVGIAIVVYSLIPTSHFPTPLWQTTRALEHLFSVENVKPSNLVLVGDSAGGNLVAQVLSSILHPPHYDVNVNVGTTTTHISKSKAPREPPHLNTADTADIHIRIRGAYMMSPWVGLTGVYPLGTTEFLPSFTENNNLDILTQEFLIFWGTNVLNGAPHGSLDIDTIPYLDPLHAPDDWYQGLQSVVERVLVSTGSKECLRDADRVFFEQRIKPYHGEAEFWEQEGGVHIDPCLDFQVGDEPLRGALTPRILEWVWECFSGGR